MLLKLRVRGFKNLRDVTVRFGPFTAFFGPNGVGKSNLFDAIQFLRHLADEEIHEAAERIRRPAEGSFSPLDLVWNRDPHQRIEFEADMLLPPTTVDDFGGPAKPSTTLVTYRIALVWSAEQHRLVLSEEELRHLRKGQARELLGFPASKRFRDSAAIGKRHSESGYISTDPNSQQIKLHQDGGSRGRPVAPGRSPRTILGGTNTSDYPTVLAARREMASWCLLQLEPSSLRSPDRLGESKPIDEFGRHIAATLDRLDKSSDSTGVVVSGIAEPRISTATPMTEGGRILVEAANRLRRLVPSIEELRLFKDRVRDQVVVEARFRGSRHWLPPRSLSEGTLRFLAMTVLFMDTGSSRVLCIEEPENGIYPFAVPTLVDLLRDYAVDPNEEVSPEDNPLRQVVVNSHSPEVAKRLSRSEVLLVEGVEGPEGIEASVRAIDHEENWRGGNDGVTPGAFERIVGGVPIVQAMPPLRHG